jgi:hypothetical protein
LAAATHRTRTASLPALLPSPIGRGAGGEVTGTRQQPRPTPTVRPPATALRTSTARHLRGRLRNAVAAALAILLPAAAVPQVPRLPENDARGQRIEYELELGSEFSDNRARKDPKDDPGIALVPRLTFWFFRHGSRLETRVAGRAEHYQWLGSDFRNDVRLRLAAIADASIAPELLYWTFQDFADVQPIDLLDRDSPDNRQQTNVFVTGPTLKLHPQGPLSGVVDARYGRSYAERTKSFNSERVSASARLQHERRNRLFSIGAEAGEARYLDPLQAGTDHERVDLIARFATFLRWLSIDVAAGRSRIDFEDGNRMEGPLLRALVDWAINSNHHLRLHAGREFSDSVSDLIGDIGRIDRVRENPGRPQVRPEIYRRRAAALEWRGEAARAQWSVTPYFRDYDYPFEIEPLSHEATGVQADASYALNSQYTLRGEAELQRRRFDADGREDRDRRLSVYVERQLNTRWALRAGISNYHRNSNSIGANYNENVLSVALVMSGGRQ